MEDVGVCKSKDKVVCVVPDRESVKCGDGD